MNILCTGATGFIGSHLVNQLKKDYQVVVLRRDCFQNQWLKKALEDTIRIQGDIRNQKVVMRCLNQYEVDWIFHLAAASIVKRAYKNPVGTFETNVMGTVNVLDAARRLDITKTLVMVTDKIFGNQREALSTDRYQPTEPYGSSKICQDVIARCFAKTYSMNIVIPRSVNVFGFDFNNRIVPNTIKTCLRGENPVIFEGEPGVREYIHIRDLVDALIYLMRSDLKGRFNIGTGQVLSQKEVVLAILEFFPDLKPEYIQREKPPQEISYSSVVCNVPCWKPLYTFKQGIEKAISQFKKYRGDWM